MTRPRLFIALLLAVTLGAASSASAALRVTVRPGDTLVAIGARHGVSATSLAAVNSLRHPELLAIGTTLTIPTGARSRRVVPTTVTASRTHTVRRGETLASIALRTGTSASALARRNGIANPNLVVAGTRLRLVAGGAAVRAGRTPNRSSGYVIRRGDTLSQIAARHGVSAAALARANAITNPNLLPVGTRLRIAGTSGRSAPPATTAGTYRVRTGDTLATIAARSGTSITALAARNGLRNPHVIRIGQRLRVPGTTLTLTQPTGRPGAVTRITVATAGWAGQPTRASVASQIASSAARYGVDPALVRAVAWQESGWWQGARSTTGAMGVMQLMPETAAWVGPTLVGRRIDPTNLRDNVDGGAAYLAWLLRKAPTRDRAVASYYQGLASVSTRGLYDDTKAYVSSVNSHYGVR